MSVSAQTVKRVRAIDPLLVNNATATAIEIDTKGYAYAELSLYLGVTDIALTALKVTESDTSGSGYGDVPNSAFGTANNIAGSATTLPSATDDSKFFVWDLDLRNRKRFLKITATVGNGSTGANLAAWCDLSRGQITPYTASDRGLANVVRP